MIDVGLCVLRMCQELSNITVILNEPRYPENIGAVARCCRNMGVGGLRLVCPACLDMEKVLKTATHEAADVVSSMEVFHRLEDALADIDFLAGTTARTGRRRRSTHSPRGIAAEIAALGPGTRTGILFGSEKWGLNNEHLSFCNSIVTIPTSDFSSINLAQSVMILCYETFVAISGDLSIESPRLASFREREGMFRHLHETFESIGYRLESASDSAPEIEIIALRPAIHPVRRVGIQRV